LFVDSEPGSSTGLINQAKGILATCLSAIHNRGELFLLELEEEKTRVLELFIWAMAVGFLGLMFLISVTVLVIFSFPPEYRLWALGAFCALYLVGAIIALFNVKALIKSGDNMFAGSLNEMKKDQEWLESSK